MPAIPISVRNISERAGDKGWHALVDYDGPYVIGAVYTLYGARGKVRQRYVAWYTQQGSSWPLSLALEVVWSGLPWETTRKVTKAELYAALRGE